MDKIKLYEGYNKGTYYFSDAGSEIELDVSPAGGRSIRLGDVILAVSPYKKVDCGGFDIYEVYEPSYFEIVSGETSDEIPKTIQRLDRVWCYDPRLIMIWFAYYWVESKLALYDVSVNLLDERRELREQWLGLFSNLVNPLPSMEEATAFLKTNDLTHESKVWVSPETYVNVPAKFQALVEKYKAR